MTIDMDEGQEDDEQQIEAEVDEKEHEYTERRTKDKALEDYETLKKTNIDFTNYQKVVQDSIQTLNSIRLLIGVEDHRLEKVSEDVNLGFNSISKQEIRRGMGGIYEGPAILLRQAMDFFEDRKELTELERAYLRVLVDKLYKSLATMDGVAITNRAIDIMKEIQVEKIQQFELLMKDWVKNQLEAFAIRIKAYEELDLVKKEMIEKNKQIAELEKTIISLKSELLNKNEKITTMSQVPERKLDIQQPIQQPTKLQEEELKPDSEITAEDIKDTTEFDNLSPLSELETKNIIGEKRYEKFARMFEEQIREGKSPNYKLAVVTHQLKAKGLDTSTARRIARHFKQKYANVTSAIK